MPEKTKGAGGLERDETEQAEDDKPDSGTSDETEVEESSEESFPASDPPAW